MSIEAVESSTVKTDLLISHEDPWYYSLIQGYCGGLITVLAGHPFDTVRIRLQTHATKGLFKNLYFGVSPPLMFATSAWSANFWSYQQLLKLLNATGGKKINEENKVQKAFIAGGISGIVWGTWMCPIELVRCYSQRYHLKTNHTISNIVNTFGRLNAVKLLYRGWFSTMYRDIPGVSIWFGVTELNRKYLPYYNESKWMHFVSGSLVGLATWYGVMPFDVIKSNIQTQFIQFAHEAETKVNYKNIPSSNWIHNFRLVHERHNRKITKLWTGAGPMTFRVIICGGLNVVYQEYLSRTFLHVSD